MASGNYNITDSISIKNSIEVNKILSKHKEDLRKVIIEYLNHFELVKDDPNRTKIGDRLMQICDLILDPRFYEFIDSDTLLELVKLFNDGKKPRMINKIAGVLKKKRRNTYKLSRLVKNTKKTKKTKKSYTNTDNLMTNMSTMMSGVDYECLELLDKIKDIHYFKQYDFICLSVNKLKQLINDQIEEQIIITRTKLELEAEEIEKQKWIKIISDLRARLTELQRK